MYNDEMKMKLYEMVIFFQEFFDCSSFILGHREDFTELIFNRFLESNQKQIILLLFLAENFDKNCSIKKFTSAGDSNPGCTSISRAGALDRFATLLNFLQHALYFYLSYFKLKYNYLTFAYYE